AAGGARRDCDDGPRRPDGAGACRRLPDRCGVFGATGAGRQHRGARMSPAIRTVARRKSSAKPAVKPAEDKEYELLFEVGCEEIPAGMLARATDDLKSGFEKQITAESIADGVTIEAFSTP